MSVKEAIKEIESHIFAAKLNVASDIRTFFVAARRENAVGQLLLALASSEVREQVLMRSLELAGQAVDPRYENPRDTALAVYVWLMSLKDWLLTEIMAEAIGQAPQCWWARKISRELLLGTRTRSSAGQDVRDFTGSPKVRHSSDGGEVVLPIGLLSGLRMGNVSVAAIPSRGDLQEPVGSQDWFTDAMRYRVRSEDAGVVTVAA